MTRASTERSKVPSVGRLGLVDVRAASLLEELGWTTEAHVPLLWSLSRSPDADAALLTLIRLHEEMGPAWDALDRELSSDTALRGRLLSVIGSSLALGDHLVAHPDRWQLLVGDIELESKEALQERFLTTVGASGGRASVSEAVAISALRDAYRDRLLVLAALDLAATVENEPVLPFCLVGQHLSDLADAALTAALAVAVSLVVPEGQDPPRLAVIAMGKCGARELNYVSDVDVIFVGEEADSLTTRVAGEMMRIGSSTFFEVDAALRPEGKAGALVRTLDAHVAYYRRWAKTWEFQALLKARPAAGDPELGKAYIDALMPMVWAACEREAFVPEVQAMRRRVESLVPADLREREIKLGTGGLRDVEFAVQLLQLVHGRADESLHVASTVEALAVLSLGGYIGRDDGANLTASYEFLRLLEHRLQLQRLKRTHTLPAPEDTEAMRWLARAAHVRPDGQNDALGVLRAEIKRQAVRVSRLHTKLFYQPLLESVTEFDKEALGLSNEAAVRQLAALGYQQPQHALSHLSALTKEGGRRGRIQTILLPTLLDWLADTPDPDAGLLAYRRVSEALVEQTWYLRTLRDEGAVAKRLMQILGTSAYVPDLIMRAPEVIQLYADGPNGPKLLEAEPSSVAKALIASSARHADPERAIAAARSLRRRELARVASADLLGLLDVVDVCGALTSVWVAVLQAALDAVIKASIPEGQEAPASIAVIGMGRLGGGELGYGSDADVLYVCDPREGVADSDAARWSATVAEKVGKLLGAPSTDPPLQVDTGLRPEGRNGPMVRTLAAYETYYAQWAQPWEVQALLRAHSVAGDPDLGLRFLRMIDKARYPAGGIALDAVREIRRIKARVDAERLPRGADPNTNTKLGRGGLADVEWTVQLLQLRYAHEHQSLHSTSTLQTLQAAADAGIVEAEDAELLRQAWLTATNARNALVLARGKPTDQLPGPGRLLNTVAAAAGWPDNDGGEFLDNYLRVTRRAKAVVQRVFGE
ncbi:glutamate-ammonia-ligase adenylyltransferase [Mycobacteroides chelonae]|nr:glutamate-ammonia-ligase adenylyltransferase [Mycobacteroides chelonae]